MRRVPLLALVLLGTFAAAPVHAHGPAPVHHGPDPASVDAGPAAGTAGAASTRATGDEWCGEERSTDDREHEVDTGGPRYHAVYAIPSDGRSRLRGLAPNLQSDLFQASGLLERLYGRAIRLDMGTSCGPANVDITTVRLRESTAELAAMAGSTSGTLHAVAGSLDRAGFPTLVGETPLERIERNYVVWLDGPGPHGACGQAYSYEDSRRTPDNLHNLGGKVALVFAEGRGFCGANTVRHEIGHTLGALQPSAPNAVDGTHCDDAVEDTMCLGDSRAVADGRRGQFFDYGNDDYWDPAGGELPWWTVNLSRFVCPDVNCNVPGGAAAPPEPAGEPPAAAPPTAQTSTRPRPARRRKPRVRAKTQRLSAAKQRWRVGLRVIGDGRAEVTVGCRGTKSKKLRTVVAKRVVLPRTISVKVTCATRPKVRARAVG